MRATYLLIAATGLALSACSKQADEAAPQPSDTAGAEAGDAAPSPGASEIAPEPSGSEAASLATVTAMDAIPEGIRGRWGLVPKDCNGDPAAAKGLLVVSGNQLKFYESVAKLGKIKEADASHIRAAFAYSGEGQTWSLENVLELQDGGKTLVRRDYGQDAAPAPLKYSRCA